MLNMLDEGIILRVYPTGYPRNNWQRSVQEEREAVRPQDEKKSFRELFNEQLRRHEGGTK